MVERSGFAERLRALRGDAGLSQAGLAERAGVPVATVRQFEQGRREPTYATLLKLARGLGLSLAAFDQPAATDCPAPAPRRGRRKPAGGGE
jgi:transcriptional regulator with XRE-family HTH domain